MKGITRAFLQKIFVLLVVLLSRFTRFTNRMSGNFELRDLRASPDVLEHQANKVDCGDLIIQMDTVMTDQSQNPSTEEEVSSKGRDSVDSSCTK